jgi:hypothetical protein
MKKYLSTLSDTELTKLKRALNQKYVTAGLSIIAVGILIHVILLSGDYKEKTIIISEFFFLFASGFIVFLTLYLSKDLKSDINESSKTIVEFYIDNKGYYEDDEPGIGGSVTEYFILSEGNKFIVDKTLFDKAEKGDTLIRHFSTNEREFLKYEIRKTAGK